jgi:hypothetical protein
MVLKVVASIISMCNLNVLLLLKITPRYFALFTYGISLERVLMMVYDVQDYWVFGLCPSSGILKTLKNTMFRKLDLFLSSGEGTGDNYSVGPVRKS